MAELILATPFRTCLVLRSDGEQIVASDFVARAKPKAPPKGDAVLKEASTQLRAYFAKKCLRFDLPLRLVGTPLQVDIWDFVSKLAVGEIISYGDVARVVGSPGAHRAVAAAMGKSPYALLIPAHRVIGSDGHIKGAGPNSMRRRLLEFEGIYLT
jgi:methylated-DNA-[protein]-cysteine S-methyltransferase